MDRLKKRIAEEVKIILTEGKQDYLRSLSRAELLDVLERELRFFGTYTLNEKEAVAVVHALLEEHIDQWRERYLAPRLDLPFVNVTWSSADTNTIDLTEYYGLDTPKYKTQITEGSGV